MRAEDAAWSRYLADAFGGDETKALASSMAKMPKEFRSGLGARLERIHAAANALRPPPQKTPIEQKVGTKFNQSWRDFSHNNTWHTAEGFGGDTKLTVDAPHDSPEGTLLAQVHALRVKKRAEEAAAEFEAYTSPVGDRHYNKVTVKCEGAQSMFVNARQRQKEKLLPHAVKSKEVTPADLATELRLAIYQRLQLELKKLDPTLNLRDYYAPDDRVLGVHRPQGAPPPWPRLHPCEAVAERVPRSQRKNFVQNAQRLLPPAASRCSIGRRCTRWRSSPPKTCAAAAAQAPRSHTLTRTRSAPRQSARYKPLTNVFFKTTDMQGEHALGILLIEPA